MSERRATGGRDTRSPAEEVLRCLYRAALRLLPGSLRRAYGREMEELVVRRLRERRRRGLGGGLLLAVAEMADVLRVAVRLRASGLGGRLRPSRGLARTAAGLAWRRAVMIGRRLPLRAAGGAVLAAVLLMSAADVHLEIPRLVGGAGAGTGGAAPDSLDFRARDPAGEFTLSIRRGRVEAATVDGRRIPERRVVQAEDSIHVLARDGESLVSVHFDPGAGEIRWDPRARRDARKGRSPRSAHVPECDSEEATGGRGPSPSLRAPTHPQEPPANVVRVVARVADGLRALGPELGPAIWPGFRPDTIPVRFVVPEEGALLAQWGTPLPEGYGPVRGTGLGWRATAEPGAASTGSSLAGRPVAQVVVHEAQVQELLETAVHEAFHVFSGSLREEGKWFGARENSFLVTAYPVFDPENEREVVLEGRLLREGLAASSRRERVRIAEQFLAVRESRHRRLGHELARFEAAAEMNEGLAEYALVRAREAASRLRPAQSDSSERAGTGGVGGGEPPATPLERFGDARALRRLENLAGDPNRSVRLRFYSTGPAMALLLDRLGSPDWKRELMRANLSLQDELARAVDYRERERRLRRTALDRHEGEELTRLAQARIASLRARRRARAEEILSRPGLLVRVSMEKTGGSIGLCGMDPQNMLQGPDGLLLHTRWLRPCAGPALGGELNTPSVQDRQAGTLSAVAGPEAEVRVSVEGREVRLADGEELDGARDVVIESPRLTLRSARADLRRRGRRLELVPLPR